MRTNIVLDDKVLKEAFESSKTRTKRELIILALKLDLMVLKGKIESHDDSDYKKISQ